MSAGGAFGGNRGVRPVPPEKGVFPLDHMHLCDLEKKEYLNCLKSAGHKSEKCRHLSKKYLECRMEKNLMAKQDMSELGFGKEHYVEASEESREGTIGNVTSWLQKPSSALTRLLPLSQSFSSFISGIFLRETFHNVGLKTLPMVYKLV
ncbi:hypothetical protein U1Q18_026948 [Sarracenia purpurea var. burkii]